MCGTAEKLRVSLCASSSVVAFAGWSHVEAGLLRVAK